jgi:hypothetical protein
VAAYNRGDLELVLTVTVTQPVAILNILDDGGMIVGEYRLADESEAHKTLESLQ